jgi:hypothetical protein
MVLNSVHLSPLPMSLRGPLLRPGSVSNQPGVLFIEGQVPLVQGHHPPNDLMFTDILTSLPTPFPNKVTSIVLGL